MRSLGYDVISTVNANTSSVIYHALDVGAQGIIVPHVNTADEAQTAAEAAKFAPVGIRGNFISRQGYGINDYLHKANDATVVVVQIEDIVAIDNLPQILSVENIDVFFVASGDLAQSMGHLGNRDHPDV